MPVTSLAALPKLTVCDSQTVFELCFDAKLIEPYVDFWTSTMYQNWPNSNTRKQNQVLDDSSLQVHASLLVNLDVFEAMQQMTLSIIYVQISMADASP